MKGCRVCGLKVKSGGLCSKHLHALQRHGDPYYERPRAVACLVPGCTEPPRARSLCKRHWSAWDRDGKKRFICPIRKREFPALIVELRNERIRGQSVTTRWVQCPICAPQLDWHANIQEVVV